MARILKKEDGEELYQCVECGLWYEDKKISEKCQAWCKKHKSCNLEITAHAIENEKLKQRQK